MIEELTPEGAETAETEGQTTLEELTSGAASDAAVIDALTAQRYDLAEGLATVTAERDALAERLATITAERDALKSAADKADKKPAARAEKAPKLRKLGPVAGNPLTLAELTELIWSANKVEVAFGNGRTEIAGVPAQVISGDAWAPSVAGLALRGVPLSLTGPVSLHGYGLLLDGELVAYRARHEVLEIPAGCTNSLDGDVVF